MERIWASVLKKKQLKVNKQKKGTACAKTLREGDGRGWHTEGAEASCVPRRAERKMGKGNLSNWLCLEQRLIVIIRSGRLKFILLFSNSPQEMHALLPVLSADYCPYPWPKKTGVSRVSQDIGQRIQQVWVIRVLWDSLGILALILRTVGSH